MSVILITGSCGLVGSEATSFFIEKGFDVVGIDNNTRRKLFGKDGDTNWIKKKLKSQYRKYTHYDTDIRSKPNLEKIYKKYKKNIILVIHCAAQPSHDWAYKNPRLDFEINALATLNLLELTKKYCLNSSFIFMSTNKVYGDNPNNLNSTEYKSRYDLKKIHQLYNGISEEFSLDRSTHSLFGVSKTYADLLVQEYGKNFGINSVSFRAGCITGPTHSSAKLHGFLSFLVKNTLKHKRYQIIGYSGKQVRDNIHSYDLINCFWEFFKKPVKGEVFNIGGGRFSNCSILEAVKIIEKKKNIKVNFAILTKKTTKFFLFKGDCDQERPNIF